MLTRTDIIEISLSDQELEFAVISTRSKLRGGYSGTRQNKAERRKFLYRDNLVGSVGEVALCKYLYGNITMYRLAQFIGESNSRMNVGDGGFDIPGLNIDVKSTFVKGKKDILTYHLAVNQREFKEHWNYVLALVEGDENNVGSVYLAGWLYGTDLDRLSTPNETFSNSRAVQANLLNPLPRFNWSL